jgi:hypothetical protein
VSFQLEVSRGSCPGWCHFVPVIAAECQAELRTPGLGRAESPTTTSGAPGGWAAATTADSEGSEGYSTNLRGLQTRTAALAGFPAGAVAPVVVEPVGDRLPLGQPTVPGEASELSVAAVDPTTPVGYGVFPSLRHDECAMGITSEAHAGHLYTPSGRSRISGWPHSQAWWPATRGSSTI